MTTLIIAGHGNQKNGTFDPGASGYIKKGEHKYMVEDLFPAMKRHLPKNEDVIFYSAKKVSNYGNLVSLVKKYNAKAVIEFHFDAHTLGSTARNGHVIVHSDFAPDKLDLAIRDVINDMVGVRYTHKGHKGIAGRNNLYNVNTAKNNGINYRLVELGFGTNKTDSDILINNVDEYAKKLVQAIVGKTSDKPNTPSTPKPNKPAKKSNAEIAREVLAGKWGNNPKRKQDLIKAGYNYNAIQAEVNKLAGGTSKPSKPKKTINQMAQEVRAGKHGTGHANRRKSLGISQSEYNKVRAEVNRLEGVSSAPKSFNANNIAQQIKRGIDNKGRRIPNGHANRQRHFGLTNAQYQQVRSIVNRIM